MTTANIVRLSILSSNQGFLRTLIAHLRRNHGVNATLTPRMASRESTAGHPSTTNWSTEPNRLGRILRTGRQEATTVSKRAKRRRKCPAIDENQREKRFTRPSPQLCASPSQNP